MSQPTRGREYEGAEIAYEDAMAERYDRDYHEPPIMKRHDEDFAKYVASHFTAGDRVLDLGCGPGSHWTYWERDLVPSAAMIGVDIAPGMIELARRNWPGRDFRVGSTLELPVDSGSIDLVIASSTLHHIPDERLPDAMREIQRVLTEHGTIVGREPVGVGRLADEPGWLSGAIMSFRHAVSRLTKTREYSEPENGSHHHAYDPKVFFNALTGSFAPKALQFRHPFSYYVARVDHPLVESIALWFDEWLRHEGGQEFYYAAQHNYADAADVARCIENELAQPPQYDRVMFMALLQQAAELLERELGRADRDSREP